MPNKFFVKMRFFTEQQIQTDYMSLKMEKGQQIKVYKPNCSYLLLKETHRQENAKILKEEMVELKMLIDPSVSKDPTQHMRFCK